MDQKDYFEVIWKRYERYFDLKRNINLLGENFDIFASFKVVNNRTLITKRDVVDSYENNEFCMVKGFEELDANTIENYIRILKDSMDMLVKPHRNHMNTYITGVMVSYSEVASDVIHIIRSFKFTKPYKLYLHGWSEIRLIVVDLSKQVVITNRAGKKVKKVYQITP